MKKSVSRKNIDLVILVITAFLLLGLEIARITSYCLTWDESLTYMTFVVPVFHNNMEGAIAYLSNPISSPANNHLLNTLLIGLCDKITGIRYNEYIIRFPVFCFFMAYICICIYMYYRKMISFVQISMLLLSYYVNEFFALARGYAMALALVMFGMYYWLKWVKEKRTQDRNLVTAIFFFTMAEFANTVTLLTVAACYIMSAFLLLKRKRILNIFRKFPLKLFCLSIMNMIAVRYHFYISKNDGSLYCNNESSVYEVVKEYASLLVPQKINLVVLIYFGFLVLCLLLLLGNRLSVNELKFTAIWVLYLLITWASVVLTGKGFPTGRGIIPGFPIYVLHFGELIKNVIDNYKIKKKLYTIIRTSTAAFVFIVLVFSFIMQINLETTRDWSNSMNAKKWTYQIYEQGDQVSEDYFETFSWSIRFYRQQIIYRYGYDIYLDEE